MRRLRCFRSFLSAILVASALLGCGGNGAGGTSSPLPVADVIGAGELKAVTHLKTVSAAQIAAALSAAGSKAPAVTPRYAVDTFRIDYLTIDGQGQPILASGLVSVPLKPAGALSPVISYQHGTSFQDAEAPSNKVEPAEPPLILASQGAIVLAPDYVGYGASKAAQHPYLLSGPAAAAVVDLLTAAKTWRGKNAIADNGQLFLVGYSEGAHVTMAAHRALQAGLTSFKSQLVSVTTGAGPYHVGVTLDAVLARVRAENKLVGALINPGFLRYLGSDVRDEVRRLLFRALVPADADVTFQSTFLDNFLADDTAAIERDSSVYDWKPDIQVNLYHGRDDQTVAYASSTATLQAMQKRGASAVSLTDCSAAPASHLGCVPPFLAFMLQRLGSQMRDL